jgi:hypothetical protein
MPGETSFEPSRGSEALIGGSGALGARRGARNATRRSRRRSRKGFLLVAITAATAVVFAEHHSGDWQLGQGSSVALVVTEPFVSPPGGALRDLSRKGLGPFQWKHDLSRVTVIKCGKNPLACEAGVDDFPRGGKYTSVTVRVAGEGPSGPVNAEIVVTRLGGWFFGLGRKSQLALPARWMLSERFEFKPGCPAPGQARPADGRPSGPTSGDLEQTAVSGQPGKPTGGLTPQPPATPGPGQARRAQPKFKYCVVPEPELKNLRIVGVLVRDGDYVVLDEDGTKTGDSFRLRFSEPGH